MARNTDPLRRESIDAGAAMPGARITAPSTNAALQLADSLSSISAESKGLIQGIAKNRADAERSRAAKDALEQSGAKFADAVRDGRLQPTQNPWYVKAYNTESAAIRANDALSKLQIDSQTWDNQDDPVAFAAQWREKVGELTQEFEGQDSFAGFNPVANQFTQQALATNQAKNAQRIVNERKQNVGQLATEALLSKLRANGGVINPNEAFDSLLASKQNWFATGGDQLGWEAILEESVTATARQTQDTSILNLIQSPELLYGPTSGHGTTDHGSVGDTPSAYSPIRTVEVPPSEPGEKPKLQIDLPAQEGFTASPVEGRVSSYFGSRAAPIKGASTYHKGVDIAVPAGTSIKAPAAGRVVSVGAEGKSGNVVRIDHGNGVVTSYAHLSAFDVHVGDVVEAGQDLAKAGSTGNSTGSHLHWTVKVDGKAVNPLTFKGKLGGTVEGEPSTRPTAQALAGFPGQDQPFTAAYTPPPNHFGAGPSLYSRPGVSERVEQARYYIDQQAQNAPLTKLRQLEAQRSGRAAQALDGLYANPKYGTSLLTGNYDRDTLITELSGQGYSAPEIAKVFSNLKDAVADSVGVQNARLAARTGNPDQGLKVLNLQLQGIKDGYTPEYEDEVSKAVLSGDIQPDDAARMIAGALSKNRQEEADARSEAAADRAAKRASKPTGAVNSASELKAEAENLTQLLVRQARKGAAARDPRFRDDDWQKNYTKTILARMQAWLAAHPGDYEGALVSGRNATAASIRALGQEPKVGGGQAASPPANKAPSAPRPSSSNPLG